MQKQLINRSSLVLFICFTLIGGLYVLGFQFIEGANAKKSSENLSEEVFQITGPKTINVHLRTAYLDGEIIEEVVQETIWAMEDFWASYDDWQLIDQNEEQVIFQKEVPSISPLSKANGYFGISSENILTMYDGKPSGKREIKKFFQLDLKKLEANYEEALSKGIDIKSTDHYQDVLNKMSNYEK
ncbi:intercompartmental signaling factor BofC [Bacillus taeanensis]|uniref:Regulator n=1 Tax=Bacillus taeanensis TaxID=273032 RepID=A0A366XWZ2_9BACI|nr:intercompartmental signaling factor BofC [Bacillus taeanensis]RBW70417.1 regulator [Bacillus taeanensis]